MTYLGTRPILQDELLKYELHHRARIAIKPGITGMWQVSGRSDITDFEEVVRLDDYQLVCPSHGMFDVDMKPCERCLDGHYIHCLQTKCLKNSRAKSLLGTLDGYMWKYSKAYSYVDAYICCSYFLKSKLDTQKRFRDKTIGLHNFKKEMPHLDNIQKKGYVLEFGHLSRDKGTDTLLEVAKKMPNTEFVFIGYGPSVDKMKDIIIY